MSLSSQVKDAQLETFIKAIADKLYNGIQTAYNRGERRRWIWELVQNAKDATINPDLGPVKIKVSCFSDSLTFEHNADPFDIKSLIGLVQQTSSKDSNTNSETTGKFGTGFITTHMLSKVIHLQSILEYDGEAKQFSIMLDREANTPEELIEKVKASFKQTEELCDDSLYPPLSAEQRNKFVGAFNTKFTYKLSDTTRRSALEGINDLEANASFVLLFNKRIGEIEILNEISNVHLIISRSRPIITDAKVSIFQVSVQDNIANTTSWQTLAFTSNTDGLTVAAPVVLDGNNRIVEISGLNRKVPVLFKDFPLVGTEDWIFDVVCNGEHFEPTDPRDGLYLHSGDNNEEPSPKVKKNRSLISSAFDEVLNFIMLVGECESQPTGLYRLMKSGIPEKVDQPDVKAFLYTLQSKFRNEAKKIPIVKTVDSLKPIAECRFPIFHFPTTVQNADDLAFYRLCVKPFGKFIPVESDFLKWLEIIQAESQTWNQNAALGIEELLGYLQSTGILKGLNFNDDIDTINWLNDIYAFLSKYEQAHLFERFKIVPNQDGKFILAKEAYKEQEAGIPELLKDSGAAFGKPYRDTLILEAIICEAVTKERTVKEISLELNEIIGQRATLPEIILDQQLIAAATICNVTTGGQRADDTRLAITRHLSPVITIWSGQPVEAVQLKGEEFKFRSALRFTVRYCLAQVQKTINLKNLGQFLGVDTEDKTVIWLQQLIEMIEAHGELKEFADEYRLYPDQIGDLHLPKDLALDVDLIDSYLKDIYGKLFKHRLIRTELLRQNFKTESIEKSYYRSTISTEIDQELDNRYLQNDSELALGMIDWLDSHQASEHEFPRLKNNKPHIVFKSLPAGKREPLFNLIKIDADINALTKIAQSEHLNAIAAAIDAGLDISQLTKLQEAVGGIQNLKDIVDAHLEEQLNIAFLRHLGTHVEEIFRELLDGYADVLKVEREGYEWGQDFAIKFKNGTHYLVEVKSYAPEREKVHMSKLQGRTAVDNASQYALCVLGRTANLDDVTKEYFQKNARFVMDIGHRLRNRVDAATRIEELIDQEAAGEEEGVDFDNKKFKYKISKRVWTGEAAHSFNFFVNSLIAKSKEITVVQV
jgi:hypothetical protein